MPGFVQSFCCVGIYFSEFCEITFILLVRLCHLNCLLFSRNQFFMNARQQFLSGKLRFAFDEQVVVPAALLFVIYERDSTRSFRSLPSECDQFLPPGYQSTMYKNLVMNESTKFEKLSEESARSQFLEAVSLSPFFGVHFHEAKDESGRIFGVGVGREGITEYGEDWKLCRR